MSSFPVSAFARVPLRSGGGRSCGGRSLRSALAAIALALAGCATTSREPANLYPHKLQLRAYVDSGQYARELAAVAAQAQAWIEARAPRGGGRLAVVFDLDETLFYNWPHISAMDFGWVPSEWDRWVEAGHVPPVEPVREVYRTARRLGVQVVFLTGRGERDRAGTERALRGMGCADYARLILKPEGTKGTSAAFKTEQRRRLVAEGWILIANLGDQQSDLVGGYAERTFKLPNPFYLTE